MMKASALLLLAVALTAVSVRAACPFPPGSLNGVSFDNMNSVCNAPYNTATKCAECQLAFFQSIPNLIPYFGFNSNDPQNVNLQKGLSVIQECRGQLAGPMSSALGTPRLIGLQGLMSCPTNDQAAYAPVFAYIEQHMS